MKNLEELIKLAQENDENAMLEIIRKFQPLLNKYFKSSCYNEDMKSSLELKLIEVVKLEIRFKNMRECNEGTLVNYITSSIYHEYLAVSGKNDMKAKSEFLCENDNLISLIDSKRLSFDNDIDNGNFFEFLQSILTEREFICVYYIEFAGYTAEVLSKKLGITKQACNQCKLRAFAKLRNYFKNNND